jgi:hypothetical protein
MRTKTLLLSAVLGVAIVATSLAQVYSVNVVGYVNKDIPAGLSMIANPLKSTSDTLGALIPAPPLFSNFYKWNGAGFDIATFTLAGWDLPALTLNPGEGAFLNTDSAFTITFVGEVMEGNLVNPIPALLSIRASMVPQAGTIEALGLTTLGLFDNLYKWDASTTNWVIYTLAPAGWDPSVPSVAIAEPVFIYANAACSWDRNFTVPRP